jgi:ABC-type lipoprotein release transport system permease subunit
MILLKLISWPYVRKHRLRWLLTLAGIVLGVAVFVGMHTANQSVLYAFHQTVDRIAGATQLQISAGETGFDENVLERVQAVPDVRVAAPVIEAVVSADAKGQGNVLILGVDMTGDRGLRDYDLESSDAQLDDPLIFLAQPDSLIVTDSFARENGLRIGSTVPMSTMQGAKRFTVRGIMKSGGLAGAFGGNLAVMDVYAAQKVFGRGRKFDRIDLTVKEGASVEGVRKRLQQALGAGFQVEEPSARAQQFESISHIYSLTADITSAFALFIGMFIIYNTFQIAVTQRRSEIGILRALGATRRQIRDVFLAEGALSGLIGSCLGLALGIVLARAMTGYIGALLGEVFGIAQRAREISTNPVLMIFAIALGTLTSIVAAFIPARNAAGVDPVQALQKGKYQQLSEGENRARRIGALVVALGALVCAVLGRYSVLFYLGDGMAVLAALLLTPTLAQLVARGLRPLLKWLRPVEGTLAADSLLQAPRRTSGAVAALMLSIALVVALGGLTRASYDSILKWMNVALNPDLFVSTSESLTARSFRFPASMGDQLRSIPGVAEAQGVRDARIPVGGGLVIVVAGDAAARGGRSQADVSSHRRRQDDPGFRELRASARLQSGRCGAHPQPRRSSSPAHRRHRDGLLRSTRQRADGPLRFHALLERRLGECFSNLSGPRRRGGGRETQDSGTIRPRAPIVRPHQSRRAALHNAAHRSMVRHHLRADRGRGSGGDSGHCEYADRVDYGPAARAGRVTGGGRTARADSSDDLAGGPEYRRGGADSRPCLRRAPALLQPADHRHRRGGLAPGLRISLSDLAGVDAGYSRGGVYFSGGSGRIGGARIAGGSAGI